MGSANWLIECGTLKIGILTYTSTEGEYRHPLTMNIEPLKGVDVLLIGSLLNHKSIQTRRSYSE